MKAAFASAALLSIALATTCLAQAKYPITVEGQVKNTTVNSTGTVYMQITQSGKCYRAKGEYKVLFGKFDIPGTLVSHTAAGDTYKFNGKLEVGAPGSGWKSANDPKYEMTVLIKPNGPATGTYHIWPFQGMAKHQYGNLDMTWTDY